MNETKLKRMVSRNVAISLGLICIVLIALIGYFTVTGISAENSYNDMQNQNKQLQTWLDGNETLLKQAQDNNTSLQNQIVSDNATITNLEARVVINGITYSTIPTSYSAFLIGYFTLLPKNESDPSVDFGMQWHNWGGWLITAGEPLPPNSLDLELANGNPPVFAPMDPDPYGSVMINSWLYSQIPTNLTEFTMPQFATPKPLWTYTANEPLPQNATILLQTQQ